MLKQLGYEVTSVANAAGALEALGKKPFDLVVSDIVMAGAMDGIALANEIREGRPKLPVLLVTGYSEAAAQANTGFTVLRKPFELGQLNRAVSRLIARSKQPSTANVVELRPRPSK